MRLTGWSALLLAAGEGKGEMIAAPRLRKDVTSHEFMKYKKVDLG